MSRDADGQLSFLGIKVANPLAPSKSMQMIASVDPRFSVTFVNDGVTLGLDLPRAPAGFTYTDGNGREHLVYQATVEIGEHAFDTNVVLYDMQLPAVVGSDLIVAAVQNDPTVLYDLFNNPLVRALTAAARSKRRTVLVIGPYGDDIAALRNIKNAIDERGFIGALLADHPDIVEQSLPEKLLLFGSISRFVLCLDTRPSGHNAELETCARAGFVTAVLRPNGMSSTWVQEDIVTRHNFMRAFPFSTESFDTTVSHALQWAEEKVSELAASYDAKYPWRNRNARLG